MKHDEAAKIVAVLFASYPNGKFDRDNARAFVDGIADLDAAACGAAVQRLVRTSKFLPSIAEIREAATAQQRGPRKTGAEAYEELLEAVQRHGRYPEVRWRDGRMLVQSPWPPVPPDVARAVRQTWGSWDACCTETGPDAPDRARFIAAYDGLSERERADLVSGQALPAPATSVARIEPRNNRAVQALVSSKGAAADTRRSFRDVADPGVNEAAVPKAFRHLGNHAVDPTRSMSLQCDGCRVSWVGCSAAHECPECGEAQPFWQGEIKLAQPRARPAAREPRRWTAEELDAELARTGGAR